MPQSGCCATTSNYSPDLRFSLPNPHPVARSDRRSPGPGHLARKPSVVRRGPWLLAAMKNCPQAASSVPGGGHEVCPVMAIKHAHRRPSETHSARVGNPRNHSALPPSFDDLERILELHEGLGPIPLVNAAPRGCGHLGRYATALHGCFEDLPEIRHCASQAEPQIMTPGSRASCPQAANTTVYW